jgi:16S rRNA (guanine(966)-N(2))-methyltransferase RsmD
VYLHPGAGVVIVCLMRVTGGTLRGRLVKVPKGETVRPTQDKVRQALFSSLAARIPGCRFLDLFAGSGAVGLEAWSRGAAYICWVESDGRTFKVLEENLQALCGGVEGGTEEQGWRAVRGDGVRFLGSPWRGAPYDVIFADPPYDRTGEKGWTGKLLEALAREETTDNRLQTTEGDLRGNFERARGGLLAEGGIFVVEQATDEREARHSAWELVMDKEYGGTRLRGYRGRGGGG